MSVRIHPFPLVGEGRGRASALSGRREHDARRRAGELVRRINPGASWTIDQFVAAEARRRRRPITVAESAALISLDAGVTGQLWTRTHVDEIVLPPGLGTAERRFAIAHEMGHLLLEHPARATPDAWVQWFDSLPAHLVRRRVAAFTCDVTSHLPAHDRPQPRERVEHEAEWFATLLLAEVDDRRERIAARIGTDKTNHMLDRLARTFGYY